MGCGGAEGERSRGDTFDGISRPAASRVRTVRPAIAERCRSRYLVIANRTELLPNETVFRNELCSMGIFMIIAFPLICMFGIVVQTQED